MLKTPIITRKNWINNVINSAASLEGWKQRGIFGLTAIVSQPAIDYYNKSVDEETRKYSVARTATKIIVGTLVGMVVRYSCLKFFRQLINKGKLLPETAQIRNIKDYRNQYASSLATFTGVLVSLVTNFLIDMPLTNWGVNKLTKHSKNDQTLANRGNK